MNLLYKPVNHRANSWPRGISQLQDTALFRRAKCFSWTFEHCKAEREQMCCYSTFPSCKVKSCWTTALWRLGKSGRTPWFANKSYNGEEAQNLATSFLPSKSLPKLNWLAEHHKLRIASDLTAKVGSKGFWGGEKEAVLCQTWKALKKHPK